MEEYILSCCSTADLSKDYLEERKIKYVCFHYELDGKQYKDDFGESIPLEDFYRAMDNGAMTRTSQVNVQEYVDHFRPFLESGKDILHLTLSTGISGTYNSAKIAQEKLQQEFPARKIIVMDSLAASAGYGLFMDKLADLRDQGHSLEELQTWAEENRPYVHHWFLSTDLTFYVRGGRISKTAGFIGNVLNICPLMHVDKDGKLEIVSKVRTKKKAFKEIVEKMKEHAQNGTEYDQKCFISQSGCYEDARTVADLIEESFPHLKGKVQIFNIGTTIGSHTGRGTIALYFWGDRRE